MVTGNKKRWAITISVLIGVIALLAVLLSVALPAQAASGAHRWNTCSTHKYIERWSSVEQLKAKGFFVDVFGEQASLRFEREHWYKYLTLDVAASPDPGTPPSPSYPYIASRITEVDTSLPVDQRVKCWQPTANKDLVVEFTVRFDKTFAPMLTENLILWNAPIGANPIPFTAIGVSRSVMSNYEYAAIVAQDVNFADLASETDLLVIQPVLQTVPDLDVTKWHKVRITVSEETALIEIAQGRHRYTPVLEIALLHPPEKLAFEFSVDNEIVPGLFGPVVVPDNLDVGSLEIYLRHSR